MPTRDTGEVTDPFAIAGASKRGRVPSIEGARDGNGFGFRLNQLQVGPRGIGSYRGWFDRLRLNRSRPGRLELYRLNFRRRTIGYFHAGGLIFRGRTLSQS